MASQQPAQTLASHLISQTLSSVALLESLKLITAQDAADIRSKLPNPYATFPSLAMSGASTELSGAMQNLAVTGPAAPAPAQSPAASVMSPTHVPPAAPVPAYSEKAPYAPPPPTESRARALWDYNGTDTDDLRFRAGDTIIIDEEVNTEWFRGRLIPQGAQAPNEKGGLFPANYVEKLAPEAARASYQPPAPGQYYTPNYQAPSPAPYMPPAQQAAGGSSTILVQEPEKKGKFGKVGNQVSPESSGVVAWQTHCAGVAARRCCQKDRVSEKVEHISERSPLRPVRQDGV